MWINFKANKTPIFISQTATQDCHIPGRILAPTRFLAASLTGGYPAPRSFPFNTIRLPP